MVLLEKRAVHAGFVVEAVHVGLGDQLDQVLVAGLVLGQEGEVVGRLLLGHLGPTAPVGNVDLAADDGLDAALPG